MLLITLTTTD